MQTQTIMGKGGLNFNSMGLMGGGGGIINSLCRNPEFMRFQFSVIIFVIRLLLSLNQ